MIPAERNACSVACFAVVTFILVTGCDATDIAAATNTTVATDILAEAAIVAEGRCIARPSRHRFLTMLPTDLIDTVSFAV